MTYSLDRCELCCHQTPTLPAGSQALSDEKLTVPLFPLAVYPNAFHKPCSETPGHTTRPGTQRMFASSPARCHLPRCTSALSRMRTKQDLCLHKLINLIIPPVQRARRHRQMTLKGVAETLQARRVSPGLSWPRLKHRMRPRNSALIRLAGYHWCNGIAVALASPRRHSGPKWLRLFHFIL